MTGKPIRKPVADTIGGGGFDGQLGDDELLTFGADADFDQLYESSNDKLVLRDSADNSIVEFDSTGMYLQGTPEKLSSYETFENSVYYSDNLNTGESRGTVAIAPTAEDPVDKDFTTIIGAKTQDVAGGNTVVGYSCEAGANAGVATVIGYNSGVEGNFGVSIGSYVFNNGEYSVAMGRQNLSKDYTVSFASSGSGMDLQIEDDTDTKRKLFDRTTGSKVHRRETVSANITTSGQEVLSVDSSGGAVTVTLSSADAVDGKKTMVKRNGVNTVTIDTEGSETIDDSTSLSLGADNNSVTLVYNADNTDWEVF